RRTRSGMLNLDTHILLFALGGGLKPHERRLLAAHEWSISAIVLWEIAKLVELGRIKMDLESLAVRRAFAADHTWPIDLAIGITSAGLAFRGAPADQLIAATSIVHRVPLLTRDGRIRKSRLVQLAK